MAIDKTKWHLEDAAFRVELPAEAAGTHIGLFKSWAVLHGFASAAFSEEHADLIAELENRSITPGQFGTAAGEALLEEELSDQGAAFTAFYYNAHFYDDVMRHPGRRLESMYHVPDTWESYETMERVLATRVDDWRQQGEPAAPSQHSFADGMRAASSRLTHPATAARQEAEARLARHRYTPWILLGTIPLIGRLGHRRLDSRRGGGTGRGGGVARVRHGVRRARSMIRRVGSMPLGSTLVVEFFTLRSSTWRVLDVDDWR